MTSFNRTGTESRAASLAETFLRPFMKLASVQPGERVIDFTPGGGEATLEAASRSGEAGEVLVLERESAASDGVAARARVLGLGNARSSTMDPARLELPDAYWDVVLCHFGLTDLVDPEAAFDEAKRVLRPVGRVVVSCLGDRERCPLVTIFLDAVAVHFPAAKGEAQRLFRFSAPGKLAMMLAAHGFEDAVPERLTEWMPFRDVDDYWETMATTSSFGHYASDLSEDAVASCKAEIERKTRFYKRGTGLELKVEVIILAAVK